MYDPAWMLRCTDVSNPRGLSWNICAASLFRGSSGLGSCGRGRGRARAGAVQRQGRGRAPPQSSVAGIPNILPTQGATQGLHPHTSRLRFVRLARPPGHVFSAYTLSSLCATALDPRPPAPATLDSCAVKSELSTRSPPFGPRLGPHSKRRERSQLHCTAASSRWDTGLLLPA